MAQSLAVGSEAPNFDLASTEDVVLMLRDEVPRMAVLLYFFPDPEEQRVYSELRALAAARGRLRERRAVVLGISRAKLPILKKLQRDLKLGYPLLYDDRDFTASYGVGASEDEPAGPALFLIGSDQRILWLANPLESMSSALEEVTAKLRGQPTQTRHYPGAVVNRVVDWWVNRIRRPRIA